MHVIPISNLFNSMNYNIWLISSESVKWYFLSAWSKCFNCTSILVFDRQQDLDNCGVHCRGWSGHSDCSHYYSHLPLQVRLTTLLLHVVEYSYVIIHILMMTQSGFLQILWNTCIHFFICHAFLQNISWIFYNLTRKNEKEDCLQHVGALYRKDQVVVMPGGTAPRFYNQTFVSSRSSSLSLAGSDLELSPVMSPFRWNQSYLPEVVSLLSCT